MQGINSNTINNIKTLIDMCKTTFETVGDVTVCKELPESTLVVVHEMIREVFDKGVQPKDFIVNADRFEIRNSRGECIYKLGVNTEQSETNKALTKEDLLEGGWWTDATNINKEALIGLGLRVFGHNDNFDSPDFEYKIMYYSDSYEIVDQAKRLKTNLKEVELNNGSFYYV